MCELPEGTITSIPSWMTDPEVCSRCSLGSPLIALESLVELQQLLDVSRQSSLCDKSGPDDAHREEMNAKTDSTRSSSDESDAL